MKDVEYYNIVRRYAIDPNDRNPKMAMETERRLKEAKKDLCFKCEENNVSDGYIKFTTKASVGNEIFLCRECFYKL